MSDFDYSDLYDSDLYEDVYLPVDPYAPATPRDPYATRVVASNTDPYDPYASGGARPGVRVHGQVHVLVQGAIVQVGVVEV